MIGTRFGAKNTRDKIKSVFNIRGMFTEISYITAKADSSVKVFLHKSRFLATIVLGKGLFQCKISHIL